VTTGAVIILGRGGSKGLPGKNERVIGGRACVLWSIDAALAAQRAGAVGVVAVSSDSASMLELAKRAGAHALERPAMLAGDTATVDDAARDALARLETQLGEQLDPVVILYANVPVRPAGLIERAVTLLRESGADCVQSYEPVGKRHPWWTAVVNEHGAVRPWQGEVLNHGVFRRQDLPPAHVPDGGVLVVRRAALRLEVPGVAPGPHAFFGKDRRGVVNEIGAVIDIDTEIDALVADAVLRGSASAPGGGRA